MSEMPPERRLTEEERREVRRQLRKRDGGWISNILQRIGRPAHSDYADVDWGKHRFGQSMILVGIFILVLFLALPDDDRRWIFIGFSWLTIAVGAQQIDKASRKADKKPASQD